MAHRMANESPAVMRTICLPIPEERYRQPGPRFQVMLGRPAMQPVTR